MPGLYPLHQPAVHLTDGTLEQPFATWLPDLSAGILDSMTGAGYGGVNLSTPTGIADLGAGFITLPVDTDVVAIPRLVTQDTANDGLEFDQEGVWTANVIFSLSHDEVNNSREFIVRTFNVTESTAGPSAPIGIGRNNGVTTFSASLLVEISADAAGDLFVIQVGGGDAIASVTVEYAEFNVTHNSVFMGIL